MRLSRSRIGVLAVLLLVALMGGQYLAGWLLVSWAELPEPLQLTSYWRYWTARSQPQLRPYATVIQLTGGIGMGAAVLCWGAAVFVFTRARQPKLHGDARLAGRKDLAKAGLLRRVPEQGILIGRWRGRYLWLNGPRHVMLVAPTRSGKSSGVAVPVLLTYEASVVVLDVKGELHALTSGFRAGCGQQILVWSPYDDAGRGHRFNPFTAIAVAGTAQRVAELQTIAAILYPERPAADPFWTNQARASFVALASMLFENWDALRQQQPGLEPNQSEAFPSLQRIYHQSTGYGKGIRAYLERVQHQATPATGAVFASLIAMPDETLASVIASVQVPLQQFLNPLLAAATNATDFDPAALRRRRITLYVIVPPRKLDEASALLNIFFSSVIGSNLQDEARNDPSITHQVLMLMDEFTSLGKLDVWSKRIAVSAGFGVRDLAIVQSQAQLRAVYGADEAQNFITNHAASVVFTPREQEDADAYSRAMGDQTLRRRQRTVSKGRWPGSRSTSIGFSEERRPLMLAQEIKALPCDEQLIFLEGCAPIRCNKNWYFKDRMLRRRLLPAVDIPTLAAPAPDGAEPNVRDASQALSSGADLPSPADGAADVPVPPRSCAEVPPLRERPRVEVGMLRNGKVLPALSVLEHDARGRRRTPDQACAVIHLHRLQPRDWHYDQSLLRMCQAVNAEIPTEEDVSGGEPPAHRTRTSAGPSG